MEIPTPSPSETPRSRRRSRWRIVVAVLAWKAYTLLVVAIFFAQVAPPLGYRAFVFLEESETRAERLDEIARSLAERLAPFDGQYYLDIAGRGYRRFAPDDPNARAAPGGNYAFFPLYPALLRALGFLDGRDRIAAMLVLQAIFAAAAALGLAVIAQRLGLPRWSSVLLLFAFPTAVFQSVLYAESLFLALTVGSALCAAQGRWVSGAALGFLAGLCRPQGILVAALWCGPLLGRRAEARSADGTRRFWRDVLRVVLPLAAPLAGLGVFCAVLDASIGEPFGFLTIQSHWSREFSAASLAGEVLSPLEYAGPRFDLVALALAVALLPALWRRLPAPLALYGTLSVALPLATGTALSFGRFLSMSFPHFLVLGMLVGRRPFALAAVIALFVVLQCVLAKGLIGWQFVG